MHRIDLTESKNDRCNRSYNDMYHNKLVSGLNATDKTPIYEMPLTFVFGGWGFEHFLYWGFGRWH